MDAQQQNAFIDEKNSKYQVTGIYYIPELKISWICKTILTLGFYEYLLLLFLIQILLLLAFYSPYLRQKYLCVQISLYRFLLLMLDY